VTLGTLTTNRKGQPERAPDDHLYLAVTVTERGLRISTTDADGNRIESIEISEFNAWSLFATLSLFLGIKLPNTKVCRSIKLWSGPKTSNTFTLKIS
jgi:hypothetical protein